MEYPFSMQMVSLSLRRLWCCPKNVIFRSQSILTAYQMVWLWIWALSVWVQTIQEWFFGESFGKFDTETIDFLRRDFIGLDRARMTA